MVEDWGLCAGETLMAEILLRKTGSIWEVETKHELNDSEFRQVVGALLGHTEKGKRVETEVDEEFEIERKRQQFLMPKYMIEYHEELQGKAQPKAEEYNKKDYIIAWLTFFDSSANWEIQSSSIENFMKFSVVNLKTSFEWVVNNFSELDLGGNCKWCGAVNYVLKKKASKRWDVKAEKEIINEYMKETRWYEG
jgi:hypothetical protein